MTFQPSAQQAAYFAFLQRPTGGNAILEAVAGAGKTTTLIQGLQYMPGRTILLAFNKKIADEIAAKITGHTSVAGEVKAATFHSTGFAVWRRAAGAVKVEGKKTALLLAGMGDAAPELFHEFVTQAVSLAKQSCFGIECALDDRAAWWRLVNHYALDETLATDRANITIDDDLVSEAITLAITVLRASIRQNATVVDFDDMLYAPLLGKCAFPKYDWVLIDEAQDTNTARRLVAAALLRAGGRLIAVGDPHQAIYGFTGADSDALELIATRFGAERLPLSVSYRCAQQVVALAQTVVPHITAHPDADAGEVTAIAAKDLGKTVFQPTDAILCRNTKPLVALAYELIRRQVPVVVEGRDIGAGLLTLVNRYRVTDVGLLLTKLDELAEREVAKFTAKGLETRAEAFQDRVDTIRVIAESVQLTKPGASVNDLREAIRTLFVDTDPAYPQRRLTLSTVHKAKGREWDRVYLLGRDKYMPSSYARQAWQQQQETNLIYVAITRARLTLVDIHCRAEGGAS